MLGNGLFAHHLFSYIMGVGMEGQEFVIITGLGLGSLGMELNSSAGVLITQANS